MNRKSLLELLEGAVPTAGVNSPRDEGAIRRAARKIEPYLSSTEEFSQRPFLQQLTQGGVFSANQAAFGVAYSALISGSAEAAVDRLVSLLAQEPFSFLFVAEIYGVQPPPEGLVIEGIRIVPWADLAGEFPKMVHREEAFGGPQLFSFNPPTAAAIVETPLLRVLTYPGDEDAYLFSVHEAILGKITTCVTRITGATDCHPIISRTWSEFTDPAMRPFCRGSGQSMPNVDGRIPWNAVQIDDGVRAFVESTYRLDPTDQERIDLALERLNLAFRRRDIGDRAVEAGICLEVLLGDEETTELSYRLRLRAALLLGGDLAEKRQTREIVSQLYALRSKRVHGRPPPKGKQRDRAQEQLARGLGVARRIVQAIVDLGGVPSWGDWELCGGKPVKG